MNLVYENEKRLVKTCFRMESRGISIDPEYVRRALIYEQGQIEQAKKDFEADTGRAFKDSPKLFTEIFDERGEKYPLTAKGNPSFAQDSLEAIDTPTTKLILKVREHEKRAGTYYSSFLYHADNQSVIHPNVRQAGTTTGRVSYTNPNLQNVPKEDEPEDLEKEFIVRGSFVPREGFDLFAIDYQAQEFRVFLDYAKEQKVLDAVMQGEDLHEFTAGVMGVPRKQAKTIGFMTLYGGGQEKLAQALGVSFKEAGELRSLYFGKFPKVKQLMRKVAKTGEARGFIRNRFGRQCHINYRSESYKLVNHMIQGTCGDVLKISMNKIDDLLLNEKSAMIVCVHDEIVFEVEKGREDLIPKFQKIMESVYPSFTGVVLQTEASKSKKSWAYRDMEKFSV